MDAQHTLEDFLMINSTRNYFEPDIMSVEKMIDKQIDDMIDDFEGNGLTYYDMGYSGFGGFSGFG